MEDALASLGCRRNHQEESGVPLAVERKSRARSSAQPKR
jgi:hypothetical protein